MSLLFFGNTPLAVALTLAILIMIPDAPPWIIAFALGIIAFKFVSEKYQVKPLSRKITGALSFLLLVQVLVQYRSLFVQEASTTLLIGLTALKIMDYKEERDLRFLFLLGFILVSLKPLYNIDFYWMAPTLICFTGLWAALLQTYTNDVIFSKRRFLLQIFVRALPLTVILFVVFPRIVVPWAQAKADTRGQMGFSDELNPGQVAELVSTRSLVFRARFLDSIELKNKSLYWRGAVLNKSLGLEWKSGKHTPAKDQVQTRSSDIRYEVLLEPSSSNYFFTLEKALDVTVPSGTLFKSEDGIYKYISMNQGKAGSYEASSGPLGRHIDAPTAETEQVPRLTERTAKWVEKVNEQFKTPELKLKELERFFSDGSFSYSLKPGFYNADDLDEFLFKRRKGFCEHFAGAYATLARALGVPSRVITGFQGGLYNTFGSFWRITTHDAHAWAEVYLNNQWERIDPTEWIAPLRLEIGAEAYFEIPEAERQRMAPGQYQQSKDSAYVRWSQYISNQFEFLNYRWTQFLLDFDKDSQSSFMTDLKRKWGWVLVLSLSALALIPLALKLLEAPPKRSQELSQLYFDLIEWAAKVHVKYQSHETPKQFSERLAQAIPDLKDYLAKLDKYYTQVVYQENEISRPEVHELKNHWRVVKKLKF